MVKGPHGQKTKPLTSKQYITLIPLVSLHLRVHPPMAEIVSSGFCSDHYGKFVNTVSDRICYVDDYTPYLTSPKSEHSKGE